MYVKPETILVLEPSLSFITICFSLLLVRGVKESLIAFSNTLRVKLAKVGDIIPQVPNSVFTNTALSIAPLFSHALIIGLYTGFRYKFSNNQL